MAEDVVYRIDRLDFTVVAIAAVLIIGIILNHIRKHY